PFSDGLSKVRALALSLLLLRSAGVQAARVDVEVEGLDEEMRDAVRSTLQLVDYGKRDISAAELRAAFKDADQQIRQALEPFGFYDVEVHKQTPGDAAVSSHY